MKKELLWEQRFRCPSKLAAHSRMHTGAKPFQCQSCDQVNLKLFFENYNNQEIKTNFLSSRLISRSADRVTWSNMWMLSTWARNPSSATSVQRFVWDYCYSFFYDPIKLYFLSFIKAFTTKSNLLKHSKVHKEGNDAVSFIFLIYRYIKLL